MTMVSMSRENFFFKFTFLDGILVTKSSAKVWSPQGFSCDLLGFNPRRSSHSQNGFVTCGGWGGELSCSSFLDG